MTAKLIIGDILAALELIPDGSIDLVLTSPPFFLQRAYLPADHPDKASEIGQENDPGSFILPTNTGGSLRDRVRGG